MTKLLDNKQIIHIVSEIVIILGITFYFSQKNKKMMNHINDLTQRIEEQEDILQKHEQMIAKLSSIIDELNSRQRGFYPMDNFKKETKEQNNPLQMPIPNAFSHSTIILESIAPLKNNNKSPVPRSSRVVEIVDDKIENNIVRQEQKSKEVQKEVQKEVRRVPEEISEEEPSEEDLDAELEEELKELD